MSEDNTAFSLVNYNYGLMKSHINGNSLDYLFLSARKYIERDQKIEVVIRIHNKLNPGSAMGVLTNNGTHYFIFVSREDAEKKHDMLRLRVAHELAHVVCRHVQEGKHLFEQQLGNSGVKDSPYDQWRHLIEDEADIFSMNMYLAHGPVVERHIPSETDYLNNIGKLFFDVRPQHNKRPSLLNKSAFRKNICTALRRDGFLHPPMAILCHALFDVFGTNDDVEINGSKTHRRKLSQAIHSTYRKRLKKPEEKPTLNHCMSCPDSHAEHCFG
jgi:hypothetical protein